MYLDLAPRDYRAMSKLLIRFSLLWSLVLFLAPVPALGNFDSEDCTVDNSTGKKTECVHASASVALNPGFCLAALVFLESCETKSVVRGARVSVSLDRMTPKLLVQDQPGKN